jgi:HAMP domain-containing protein
MPRKSGKEMRNLMLAVTLGVLLLVLAVIAYFMVDIIVTTNDNIEKNKQLVIEQTAKSLTEISENINSLLSSPATIEIFNQDFVMAFLTDRDFDLFNDLAGKIALGFYPINYMGMIQGGELVYYDTKAGVNVDPDEMPVEPYESDYEILDSLGGEEGFYVSAFFPLDLSILGVDEIVYINMIQDRTAEYKAVEDYFEEQRNDLILRLSIASVIAIILSLLLTTIGLRYFTRKYVVDPIEELNRTAEKIADGTFEGEVVVDKESAYAALQGLLQSGQKVLSRMDEELDK